MARPGLVEWVCVMDVCSDMCVVDVCLGFYSTRVQWISR